MLPEDCRIGAMPHIDPENDVRAERIKVGDWAGGGSALISRDRATENLGEGDFVENIEKYNEEAKLVKNAAQILQNL